MSETESSQPRSAEALTGLYGPDGRPQFFTDPAMDRFVATLLNLASEVWVQEERILSLEALNGAPGPAPDRDSLLKGFIDRVFQPLRETPAKS